MTHTPFQRALDGVEDGIFRLPLARRRQCLAFILRQHRRFLPARMNPAFVLETANYRDRQIVSIAQGHQLRGWRHLFGRAWLWWLWPLMVWNSLTSGIDVAEYACAWFVTTHRWIPRKVASLSMATAAIVASDLRRAPPSRVPAWCLASLRAPVIGAKICAWNLGIVRWWKWGTSPTREADPIDLSWLHGALRVGMGAAIWLLCWWVDRHLPQSAPVLSAGISATMIWNIQTTAGASDNFGGGFNAAGANPGNDYSTGTAAHVVIDGATISATVQATTTQLKFGGASGYTTAASDNRNVLQITGGTATAGFYEISVVTAGIPGTGVWQVDRSMGTVGQTITGNMGGCLASVGKVASATVSGNVINVLTGTYTISSASTNIAGGCVLNNSVAARWEGYAGTPQDLGTPPTLQAGTIATFTIFNSNGNPFIRNFILDGSSKTSSKGINSATNPYLVQCKNFTNSAITSTFGATRCSATTCSTVTAFTSTQGMFACEAYANTFSGFSFTNGTGAFLLSYSNTGSTSDGIALNGTSINNSVAYSNGRDGFRLAGNTTSAINCIAESNSVAGAFGFGGGGSARLITMIYNCGVFGNNTNIDTNLSAGITNYVAGTVTGGGSFFTNAASGDFSLNNTASAGASMRAAGYPGLFPRGTTTGYLDVGAAQHADPAGGGSGVFIFGS